VLKTDEKWFGVTNPGDLPVVQQAMQRLVDAAFTPPAVGLRGGVQPRAGAGIAKLPGSLIFRAIFSVQRYSLRSYQRYLCEQFQTERRLCATSTSASTITSSPARAGDGEYPAGDRFTPASVSWLKAATLQRRC
jgi:hypothetical protein